MDPVPSASQSAAASTVDINNATNATMPTEYGTLFTTRSGSLGKMTTTPSESPQLSTDMLSQSLTTDVLRMPGMLHRALSTSPRLEHTVSSQPMLDEKSQRNDELFFPFIDPSPEVDLSTSLPEVQGTTIQQLTSPSPLTHSLMDNSTAGCPSSSASVLGTSAPSGGATVGKERSSSVVSSTKSGIFGSGKFRFFSRNSSVTNIHRTRRGTLRQDSQLSTASSMGRTSSIFGSAMFGSPSRRSVASPRINFVMDAQSVYPSLVSLCSYDQVPSTDGPQMSDLYDKAFPPISTSNGHVSASYQDKIDQTEKLERSASIVSAGSTAETSDLSVLQRSVSLPSKYAYNTGKVAFPSVSKISAKDGSTERLEDEQIDELAELKSTLIGIIPSKKKWQQTMPDLVEGPESETLTMQSTTRNQLAMAALAIIRGEYKDESELKDEDEISEIDEKTERRKYMKNLVVMGFVFFFVFTSYLSLRNLQSSLNDNGGLGMYSLSCVYAFLFIGSIFTTTIVQRLRPKVAMVVSTSGFLLYNLANFYPSFYTLVPASCAVGFSLAVIWTSQATYMANIAASFAELTGNKVQNIMSKFHGIFFMFFQSSQIVGGLISSLLLTSAPLPVETSNATTFYDNGYTYLNTTSLDGMTQVMYANVSGGDDDDFPICGMGYCPGKAFKKSTAPIEEYMVYMLMGIFLGCTLIGILILLFLLDPLEGVMKKSHATITQQMGAVFKFYLKPNLICLIGLMLYSLLQVSFMVGEFSKAYVTCTLGIHMVGYLMVCLSVSSGVFAYCMGILQKHVGRTVLLLSALFLHLVLLVVMLLWHPTADSLPVFFAVAAGWGAADGVITTQLVSLIGTLFSNNKEPAFASYKMTQSLSAFSLFISGPYLCTRTKIFTVLVMLSIAAIGYITLEVKLRLESSTTDAEEVILKVEPSEKDGSSPA
jgi:MFS family permease